MQTMGEDKILAQDIMTKKVFSVYPETPFLDAVAIIFKYDFDGLPVVDKNNKLVGILTEYDFIVKGSMIHLPTLIKLFKKIPLHKKDKDFLDKDLEKIYTLTVKDVMNNDPLIVYPDMDITQVASLFKAHHRVNPIPVVGRSDNKLLGIISRYDIIKMYAGSLEARRIPKLRKKRHIDKGIRNFLSSLGGEFVLVSKIRTHFWLIMSILFIFIGFFIAMALIARIRIYY
jgi:CBS domain-containing protein